MSEDVEPLDYQAHFAISVSDGYVQIEQSVGDPPVYTPDQAEDIARDILDAAERAREEREE